MNKGIVTLVLIFALQGWSCVSAQDYETYQLPLDPHINNNNNESEKVEKVNLMVPKLRKGDTAGEKSLGGGYHPYYGTFATAEVIMTFDLKATLNVIFFIGKIEV